MPYQATLPGLALAATPILMAPTLAAALSSTGDKTLVVHCSTARSGAPVGSLGGPETSTKEQPEQAIHENTARVYATRRARAEEDEARSPGRRLLIVDMSPSEALIEPSVARPLLVFNTLRSFACQGAAHR
jgi:hypothetical protein